METLEATRHPYRSRPVAHVPTVHARTRRLAVHGTTIVLACLVFRWIALLVSPLVAAVVEALLIVGTWLFTLRCPADNRAARILAGALRIAATIDGVLAISSLLDLASSDAAEGLHAFFVLVVTPIVGLLYLAARLHSFGVPQHARKLVTLMGVGLGSLLLTFVASFWLPWTVIFVIIGAAMYFFSVLWGYALMFAVRRMLRVEVQAWWLDVGALPSVQWMSSSQLGDGRVELVGTIGGTSWFDDYSAAMFWLKESGFCSEEQALEQGLVDRPPTPLLAEPR